MLGTLEAVHEGPVLPAEDVQLWEGGKAGSIEFYKGRE